MKLWFSLYDRKKYTGPEAAFYDTTRLSFTTIFESHADTIKQELDNYLKHRGMQSYFNTTMVNKLDAWKTIPLKTWNVELYRYQTYFPKTMALINSVDGLVSASFNMLGPHSVIKPHCGDTNGIYRCHMGLSIPAQVPVCGFRVKEEWRSWEEGKLLVFVDANHHEAMNQSDDNRFIFLFDVVRPEFKRREQYICSTVITSLFMQAGAEKLKVLYLMPPAMQKLIAVGLVPFAFVAIHCRNFLYKFTQR